MAKKKENTMKLISNITPEIITENISCKADGFAKTFIAKCNMMNAWDKCIGVRTTDDELASIIVTTYSKRLPKIANLQLLHTFFKHRKNGFAAELCKRSVAKAFKDGCEYFRVSAEPSAVEFYKKIGFRFIGKQKSGCQLSIFKLTSSNISENNINSFDDVIKKAISSKRKGGCVEIFENDFMKNK